MRRLLAAVLVLLGGCAQGPKLALPPAFVGLPGDSPEADGKCWRARELVDAGEARRALDIVEAVLVETPDHVDAARLRQDILRQRGRLGLLLAEAEQRIEKDPADATAHYLRGRLMRTDKEKLAAFQRATELEPESFWGWFGTAFVYRRVHPDAALAIYSALYAASDRHPLTAIALASALRGRDQHGAAGRVYRRLRASSWAEGAAQGIGHLGLAESSFLRGKSTAAWPALLRAIELRPFDAGARSLVRQAVARGLPRDQLLQVIDVLQSQSGRLERFGRGTGALVLAELFSSAGMPFAARAALEAKDGRGPRDPVERRMWLRLLLRTGDVAAYLRALRESFPQALLDDETNEVRGVWVHLFDGPWMNAKDPVAVAPEAAGLVRALLRTGLLEEAEAVGTSAVLRHRKATSADRRLLETVRDEARRELAFERALRRVLYQGYDDEEYDSLDEVLAELRRISRDILGRDVIGQKVQKLEIPLVGDMVDPFGPGLCAHLASYNRYLAMGQRSGRPVEALLMVQLSKRQLQASEDLPLPAPTQEVIGEDRVIRSLSGVYGGDLAGVALFHHYIIDMDSVRDWAREIDQRRTILREDGGAALRDPLPRDVGRVEPASAHWRLSLVSPVEDADLEAAVLDMIRWHERAHLVDVSYFLPAESNLWRVLGLLFEHSFSALSIEAEMEARAELAALALSPHTRLVLAHIAVFLEEDAPGSPHAVGFRRLARRLVERLEAAGEADARASRWHQVDPLKARVAAREMLRELW